MKYLLHILFFIFPFNFSFGQSQLELKILNDTIKKVSYSDQNNIIFKIINKSDQTYVVIIDSNEFNEDPEYLVEPQFLGLPDYYIFLKENLLSPEGSFGTHSQNELFNFKENSNDFKKFKKKYHHIFKGDDIKIAYRISKKIIIFHPKEEKIFTTKINFPNYKSRFFNLSNKEKYYFQICLQAPSNIISKYYKVIKNAADTSTVFKGMLISNKVPLIYEIYNKL